MPHEFDRINLSEIDNLYHLFCTRVRRSPNKIAYQYCEGESVERSVLTWSEMANHVAVWQAALKAEELNPGDRVALMVNNCPQWVMFEQAALGLGLIVVPMYTNDRAENVAYIIDDAQIKLLFIETDQQWQQLQETCSNSKTLQRVVIKDSPTNTTELLKHTKDWLPDDTMRYPLAELSVHKSSLATVVYTSGTTGKPKGVMLSHQNILWNADSALDHIDAYTDDTFLSFLPLSHMFERTVGHYLPMFSGSSINYARSIEHLAEDLLFTRPTVLVTVPRIFERVYNKIQAQLKTKSPIARFLFNSAVSTGWKRFLWQQGRESWHLAFIFWPILFFLVGRKIMAKLGGNMRVAVSGGAPLSSDITKTFIGLGLTITQGYGLTESAPIISTNKLDDNYPDSVGSPLRDVEVKLGENDELLIRSPGIMLGYWNNDEATKNAVNEDGWLHTGDKVKIENNHIYITGRIKEILVLSNGEKVPPADIEMAITNDPLFDQIMVLGEQKPYLTAIIVLNTDEWAKLAIKLKVSPDSSQINEANVINVVTERLHAQMDDFPGYAKIYKFHNTLDPWTVENGLITPTLKLKRNEITNCYQDVIDSLYEGH